LLDWSGGAGRSERLAAQILRSEGFDGVDPAHPLGGPDGLSDVVCERGDTKWRAAAYFPRGQKSFSGISKKFRHDIGNRPPEIGFIFVTNQELRLREREQLSMLATAARVGPLEIYHLERIASILDSPKSYGVRLDFLDIEMTREEQVSFFAELQQSNEEYALVFKSFIEKLSASGILEERIAAGLPLGELREFSFLLDSLRGRFGGFGPSILDLKVPLADLREFSSLLNSLSGRLGPFGPSMLDLKVPLADLREFSSMLNLLSGRLGPLGPSMLDLKVPLADAREFVSLVTSLSGQIWQIAPVMQNMKISLAELREFASLLNSICVRVGCAGQSIPDLKVPLAELKEFCVLLDTAWAKSVQLLTLTPTLT
jgi:hypothetical protein